MIFILVAILLVAAGAICLALGSRRRLRIAAELRGDWWSRFERDLGAYMRSQGFRDAERRR
jgi:hypothetical protein